MLPVKNDRLKRAILRTVIYADIFDFPLTTAEIHRYLIGELATLSEVAEVLAGIVTEGSSLSTFDGYFFLPGREANIDLRKQRARLAQQKWATAARYGRWLAHLPFVRMVAVTGSLTSNNVTKDADLDYLIVTEPGYLWLCRAFVLLARRLMAPFGSLICPNYLITSNVLALHERELFTAQELVRMVPLSGFEIYDAMRAANDGWVLAHLPNAAGHPAEHPAYKEIQRKPVQWLLEPLLCTRMGQGLETWEMERKIRKLSAEAGPLAEISLSADQCKGHFEGHGARTLSSFQARVQDL